MAGLVPFRRPEEVTRTAAELQLIHGVGGPVRFSEIVAATEAELSHKRESQQRISPPPLAADATQPQLGSAASPPVQPATDPATAAAAELVTACSERSARHLAELQALQSRHAAECAAAGDVPAYQLQLPAASSASAAPAGHQPLAVVVQQVSEQLAAAQQAPSGGSGSMRFAPALFHADRETAVRASFMVASAARTGMTDAQQRERKEREEKTRKNKLDDAFNTRQGCTDIPRLLVRRPLFGHRTERTCHLCRPRSYFQGTHANAPFAASLCPLRSGHALTISRLFPQEALRAKKKKKALEAKQKEERAAARAQNADKSRNSAVLRASELLDDASLASARAAGTQQLEAAVAKLTNKDLKAIITYLDNSKMPRRNSAEPDKAAKREDFLSVAFGLIASEPVAKRLDGHSEESSSASDGVHMPAL